MIFKKADNYFSNKSWKKKSMKIYIQDKFLLMGKKPWIKLLI